MATKPAGLADCECGRVGYMLILCQEHAPIPYVLTDRGRRDVRKMRQWDAIFATLEERRRSSPRAAAAQKAWETRRAAGRARSTVKA
jgi:hypothetical protein